MQYEKKRNQLLVKKTRKYLKKNRFLLLNKFKKRIWLQKTDRDFYSTGCSFAQTVGNLHFTGCGFIQTDRNLRFFTENYKKLTEISVFPRRITKNWQKSPFFHGELQKTDRNLHFFTENCKKPSAESISLPRNLYTSEEGSDFLLFLKIFIKKYTNFWLFIYLYI